MKRFTRRVYTTDSGRELIVLQTNGTAQVTCYVVTPDELEELASACQMAADELRIADDLVYAEKAS